MRAGLPNSLRERRRSRADRRRRAAVGATDATRARTATPGIASAESAATADPAAQRVRDAGGPLDEASYACHCGLVFRAPVSTTVSCPHCHAPQAW